jgi:hypothetical protein
MLRGCDAVLIWVFLSLVSTAGYPLGVSIYKSFILLHIRK